jgi:hypothetical protein
MQAGCDDLMCQFPDMLVKFATGITPSYPVELATEFKRPTMLPALLQLCVIARGTAAAGTPTRFALRTADGTKDVLVGELRAPVGS